MIGAEPARIVKDLDFVGATETLLQRNAEILGEPVDPSVTEHVDLVVGMRITDKYIVLVTRHESHGQTDFPNVAQPNGTETAYPKSLVSQTERFAVQRRGCIGDRWQSGGRSDMRKMAEKPLIRRVFGA